MSNLEKIQKAIEPMRTAAMDKAEAMCRDRIEKAWKELEEANWDLKTAAPFPSSLKDSREDYRRKSEKHYFMQKITSPVKSCLNMHEPDYRTKNEDGAKSLIAQVRRDASFAFDKYVLKLGKKVGEEKPFAVVTVTSENDLWFNSLLKLTEQNGEFETWKTRTIVNCSIYGKFFFQWPTRKVKQ